MTLGNRISNLREKRGWSQSQLSDKLHIGTSTLGMWETDKRKPSAEFIVKLAEIFHVSTDYLLGNTNKKHYYDLTEKDEIDIAEQAEQIIKGIQTSADVNFYGEPATKEQMESMRDIIETGLRINKEKAKKKFTPKKYRDNGAKGGD